MAYDEALASRIRSLLAGRDDVREQKMFGGLCFLLHGNMVCGVTKDGAMYRPGKAREGEALAAGAQPLSFTGRKMGGMVELDAGQCADDTLRATLTALSLAHAATLPAKEGK